MASTQNNQGAKDFMGLQVWEKNGFLHIVDNDNGIEKMRSRSAPACTRRRASAADRCAERTEQNTDSEETDTDVLTLMIKNIPCSCTRDDIIAAIEELGYNQRLNFFYVPIRRYRCLGYAFVGFPHAHLAQGFAKAMTGYRFKNSSTPKEVIIAPAKKQGLKENREFFKTKSATPTFGRTTGP